jgi:hypothetical protein
VQNNFSTGKLCRGLPEHDGSALELLVNVSVLFRRNADKEMALYNQFAHQFGVGKKLKWPKSRERNHG